MGGLKLAQLLVNELSLTYFTEAKVLGQRLTVLRETRMPAVVLRVGPTSDLIEQSHKTAQALTSAVLAWACTRADQ